MQNYKTQVLLLHSEQSTLDRFSASLGNDYSVHLATSGTEALHTLGLTPIHVMVSAQRLPGMSGIEALREARKRSPETLGILIAPEDMSGAEVEALVGRDEVFQVIHGVGSPEKMRRIIDEAVDQLRMNSLQDSANDRSAGPRPRVSPTAPARDPAAVRRAAPTAGTERAALPAAADATELVVLSKDEVFLETVRQALSARQPVHTVDDLREAAKLIADSTSAVLVTDAAVAPRDVEAITTRLRARQPQLVTIVAGRRDDGDQLMDLINSGMVYRFLLKPISPGRARLAIEAAIRRAREEAQPATPVQPASPAQPVAPAKPKTPHEPAARKEPTLEDFEGAEEVVLSEEAPARRAPSFTLPERGAPAPQKPRPEAKSPRETRPAPENRPSRKKAKDSARQDKARRTLPSTAWMAAAGIAAVAVVAGGAWYALSGDDPSGDSGTSTAGEMPARQAAVEPAPAEPAPPPVSRELRQARAAVAEGRLLAPGGDGALALYARALADAPGDSSLATEVDQVVAEAVAGIAAALDAGRPGEARAARTVLGSHFPSAPGLAAIDRRLAEAERDRLLDRADELIAAGDADGAMAVLDEAASLLPGRSPGVEARRDSILATSDNRGRTLLLELGNQRLLQGQLVEPAADNARYYYRAVLAQDSESIAGRQGMAFLRTALITRIREALEAGDRATAERWLEEARVSGVEEARLTPFSEAAARLPRAPVEDIKPSVDVTRPAASETPPPATAADEPSAADPAVETATGSPDEAPAPAVTGTPAEAAEQTTSGPSESVESAEPTEGTSAEMVAAEESLADATAAMSGQQPPAAEEPPVQRAAEETPTEPAEELRAEDVTETQARPVEQAPADQPEQLEQPEQAAGNPGEPAPATVGPTDEPAAVEETVPASEPAAADAAAEAVEPTNEATVTGESAVSEESAPVDEPPTAVEPAGADAAAIGAQSPEPVPEAGEPVAEETPAPARPERITYVPPSYPRAAAMRGTEGWVDVDFSLTTAGEPRAIEVTDASPAGIFDEAAIDAVSQWRYQPPAESGWPEDERIRIRINFGLDR